MNTITTIPIIKSNKILPVIKNREVSIPELISSLYPSFGGLKLYLPLYTTYSKTVSS